MRKRNMEGFWQQAITSLLLSIFLIIFSDACVVAVHASSASSSSTLVLDRYGNAVQLQHALNAAQEQGSLVMVIDRTSSTETKSSSSPLWVVSLIDDTHAHLRPTTRPRPTKNNPRPWIGQPYTGPNAFLKPVLSSFSHSFTSDDAQSAEQKEASSLPPQYAVIMVGVHGDAQWMQSQLNRYSMLLWERTNQLVSAQALLGTMTTLLRQSAGLYPSVPNSHGSALELLLQEQQQQNQQQNSKFGRPLGICGLVVDLNAPYRSKTSRSNSHDSPRGILARIIPSGQVEYFHQDSSSQASMVCLGKHGSAMEAWWNQRLQQQQEQEGQSSTLLENTDSGTDVALCRLLKEGLTSVLGKAPKALCIEMWDGKTVVRRQVDLESSLDELVKEERQA